MIRYTFECDQCGGEIITIEQPCKHESILEEADWITNEDGQLICIYCRPRASQECDNGCGTEQEYWTTGKFTKEDQLHDEGWILDQGEWFCGDECHRDHLFGR